MTTTYTPTSTTEGVYHIQLSLSFAKSQESVDEELPEVIEVEENSATSKQYKIPKLTMQYYNKKGKLVKLYITKLQTQQGDFYLPSRTLGKFKNFERQVIAGKVDID